MTPERQKAEELVNEFDTKHFYKLSKNRVLPVSKHDDVIIKDAIICFKNIINATKENPLKQFYWKKVLDELENM